MMNEDSCREISSVKLKSGSPVFCPSKMCSSCKLPLTYLTASGAFSGSMRAVKIQHRKGF
jgi:hypothetical protein